MRIWVIEGINGNIGITMDGEIGEEYRRRGYKVREVEYRNGDEFGSEVIGIVRGSGGGYRIYVIDDYMKILNPV